MIGISGKVVTFILQAAAVILIVFLFSYFDPFNIFNSKKLILKDTPTIVTSIRGIGKLITAEYYGEVIKSSNETVMMEIESAMEEEYARLIAMEKTVSSAAEHVQEGDKPFTNKKKFRNAFEEKFPDLIKKQDYKQFMDLVYSVKPHKNQKEVLFDYYEEKHPIDIDVYTKLVDDFVKEKYRQTNKEKRQIQKSAMIVLGRGSIKAGIDLSNFDESHFKFYPDQNLVRLTYHQPEIISKTINPWFIPALKMKGFEYLLVGSKIKKNPDSEASVEAIRVIKQSCLDQLEADARQANILGKARQNAEIALGHFLSLLLGKDVKVEIFSHPLDAAMYDILKSKRITDHDVSYIDSLIGHFASSDFSRSIEFMRNLNDSMRRKKFEKPADIDTSANWEVLALKLRVSNDGFYNELERDSVNRYIQNPTVRPKDVVYYVRNYPGLVEEIREAKIDSFDLNALNKLKGIKDHLIDLQAEGQKLKQDGMAKLQSDCEKLRTVMTAAEIRRCDKIIGDFLTDHKLKQAFDFATEVRNYGFPRPPWVDGEKNWEFLSLVRGLESPEPDSLLTLKERVKSFKPNGAKSVFYYLFYSGRMPAMLVKTNVYWDKLIKLDTESMKIDSNLVKEVNAVRARDLDSLCVFLKRNKISATVCPADQQGPSIQP